MGQKRRAYLSSRRVYGCKVCHTHLATYESMMSKNFTGQTGQAFLFHTVVNVTEGPDMDRNMTTGAHTVRDIHCARCGTTVGWKYVKAHETSQKYKENKFILELALTAELDALSPAQPFNKSTASKSVVAHPSEGVVSEDESDESHSNPHT